MDFYEVFDQVVELLRSRGRVTYRALQRQFDLDDAIVEDLKDELIYAQRVATDEDNRVLVWAGDEQEPSPTSPPQDQKPEPLSYTP